MISGGEQGRETIIGKIKRKLQYSAFRQKWNIGVTRHPVAVVAGLEGAIKQKEALENLLWMDENRIGFAADPFIMPHLDSDEDYIILFEVYPWKQRRGRIDYVIFSRGEFLTPTLALESSFHLSYPYIFQHNHDHVVIPEHSEAKDLSLYRLGNQGTLNAKEAIDFRSQVVDSTIIYFNGRYWMFAAPAGARENVDLNIYYASDLKGPWQAHAGNPVKQDRSNARPAGQLFWHAGKLLRPAQDCGTHYGAGIIINEIMKLTEREFEEIPRSEVRPLADSIYNYGLHTISYAGNYTVIDGARIESKLSSRLDFIGRHLIVKPKPAM